MLGPDRSSPASPRDPPAFASGGGDGLRRLGIDDLLQRFPIALALLEPAGAIAWSNHRFAELFEAGNPGLSARLAEAGAASPCKATLPGRNNDPIDVLVSCLETSGARLLVLDDTPGRVDAAALHALNARVAELERESLTDRLTGAWNRRYLDQVMAAEPGRARRHREPLAAAMIDVDHFKRINDRHGHQVGDAVLREIAALIRERIRASDALVRWGGEEFLLLMPSTSHRVAAALAESLRMLVEAHPFGAAGRVTISIGVAEYLPPEEAEDLFRRTDEALYRAKRGGRNRVAVEARGASDLWEAQTPAPLQLTWHARYACGERTIDAQHEALFRLANETIEASLRQAQDRGGFLAALDRLLAEIARHFEDEERILAERGYAGLAAHRKAHRVLLERAQALRQQASSGGASFGALVEFLAYEVLAQHMLVADRDYYSLFRPTSDAGP